MTVGQNHASVEFAGYHYATLDFTPPSQTYIGTQDTFIAVPPGWDFAPDDPAVVRVVIARHYWGTQRVVVSNGNSYNTARWPTAGDFGVQLKLITEGARYRLGATNYRILIRCRAASAAAGDAYLAQLASSLWQAGRFADCEVVCDEEVTPCHRAVLAEASPVFCGMLRADMMEARQRQILIRVSNPRAVKAMLHFVYTGRVQDGYHEYAELLGLAEYYLVAPLVALCVDRLLKDVHADNIGLLVRACRVLHDKPELCAVWPRLVATIQRDSDVLSSALLDL